MFLMSKSKLLLIAAGMIVVSGCENNDGKTQQSLAQQQPTQQQPMPQGQMPEAATQTRYMLCIGEYEEACQKVNKMAHTVFRYCPPDGTTIQMNADWVCARTGSGGDGNRWFVKANTHGNKCGYTHVEVICFDN